MSDNTPSQRQIVFNWLMGEPLERVDGYWGGSEEVERVDKLLNALRLDHAELKARSAAMLEKAAVALQDENYDWAADMVRALIPTDYAAALAEHDKEIRHEVIRKINKLLCIQSEVDLERWEQLEIALANRIQQAVRKEAE